MKYTGEKCDQNICTLPTYSVNFHKAKQFITTQDLTVDTV